jgi:hypothetical protein
MRKLYFLFVIVIFISACKKQNNQYVNTDILNHKQMVDVLIDCYIAEAELLNISQKEPDNLKIYTKHYYDFIFKKHNITRNQLFDSMQYYTYRIKEFSKIYNAVLIKLTNMQSANIVSSKKSE